MPQTKADSELQPKLDCLAPFVAYAVLDAAFVLYGFDIHFYLSTS